MKRMNSNQHALSRAMEQNAEMGDYLVVFRYDPGTPKTYRVIDAPSKREARRAAISALGYDPGVLIHVRDFRKGDSADYVVEFGKAVQQ